MSARRLWPCALLLWVALPALADPSPAAARVSYISGSLLVRGQDDEEYSYVERNAVLRPGDLVWADRGGRAEVELDGDSWLRLAEDTRVEIRQLAPEPEVRLWIGSLYLDLSNSLEAGVRVRTPAGDVDVEPDSRVRIDVPEVETARVAVLRGRALAYGEAGQTARVAAGQALRLTPGRAPGEVEDLDPARDSFDRWNSERVAYYADRPLPRQLERPLVGARELADYGTWLTVDDVTYWQPRVGSDWRPYSDGYWTDIFGFGPTWIPYEPWGYTTFHYGRWYHRSGYGWLWCPRYIWAPSWVSWASYDDFLCWAPLDPWDRPAYARPYYRWHRGWFVDPLVWSYCPRNRFFRRHWHPWERQRLIRPLLEARDFRSDRLRELPAREIERLAPREPIRGLRETATRVPASERARELERRVPPIRFLDVAREPRPRLRDRNAEPRRPGAAERSDTPRLYLDTRPPRQRDPARRDGDESVPAPRGDGEQRLSPRLRPRPADSPATVPGAGPLPEPKRERPGDLRNRERLPRRDDTPRRIDPPPVPRTGGDAPAAGRRYVIPRFEEQNGPPRAVPSTPSRELRPRLERPEDRRDGGLRTRPERYRSEPAGGSRYEPRGDRQPVLRGGTERSYGGSYSGRPSSDGGNRGGGESGGRGSRGDGGRGSRGSDRSSGGAHGGRSR
ncbi:MAG: FecR domain-containing protein [Armatimonadetes bacterium]|nr:FecR domain-containing protein [Armatimonadota bacterium]